MLFLLTVAWLGAAASCSRDDGKVKKLSYPIVAIAACPQGATLEGEPPPVSFRQRCQKEATERHGASREWFPDGREMVYSEWWNGEKHGRFSLWFDNGQLRSVGAHRFGLPAGKWVYYAKDGTVLQEKTFELAAPAEGWLAQAIAGVAPVRDVPEPSLEGVESMSAEVQRAHGVLKGAPGAPGVTAPSKEALNAPAPAYTPPEPDPVFARGAKSE